MCPKIIINNFIFFLFNHSIVYLSISSISLHAILRIEIFPWFFPFLSQPCLQNNQVCPDGCLFFHKLKILERKRVWLFLSFLSVIHISLSTFAFSKNKHIFSFLNTSIFSLVFIYLIFLISKFISLWSANIYHISVLW